MGKLLPTPAFGNTPPTTVRSFVALVISRQPMSQRGCLAAIRSSASSQRIFRLFGEASKIMRRQRRFALHPGTGNKRLGIEQEAFGRHLQGAAPILCAAEKAEEIGFPRGTVLQCRKGPGNPGDERFKRNGTGAFLLIGIRLAASPSRLRAPV